MKNDLIYRIRALLRLEAMDQLGGLEQVTEERRSPRGISALESLIQDVRYALRGMRRAPAFTLTALLTLGLATAAIATVFTIAHTLLLRRMPVDRPDEVVFVQATRLHGARRAWVSHPDYLSFRNGSRTIGQLAAHYSNAPLLITSDQISKELNGAIVSGNFFSTLGLRPALGRFFTEEEDSVPDRDHVAVVSNELWRKWFGSSPEVIGATIKINGTAFNIVGVAPSSFPGVTYQPAEIYIPTMMLRAGCRWCKDALAPDCDVLDMIGRLAEGRTVEEAQAELSQLAANVWAIAPEDGNRGAIVLPATGITHPDVSRNASLRFVRLLIWFSGLLLLICCANLAGLLIARNSARGRELAIRASLGAGRMRLLRQLLTESLLLSILGGALGVVFSLALTRALKMMFYSSDIDGRPLNYDFALSLPVLLGSIIVSAAAGLCFGMAPALTAIKLESSSVIPRMRLGGWLVGAQAALAVALITIAGLLSESARSRIAVRNVETSHIALLRLRPRLIQYPVERAHWFQRAVIKRLETLSMVESVSIVGNGAVLVGRGAQLSLPRRTSSCQAACIEIGPRYFETLRTPLLGREFDERDSVEAPRVAIVNETLAQTFWPGETVIGAIINVNGQPHRIVGIAGDIPLEERGAPSEPYVYTPYWQNPALVDSTVCVRVNGDPAAIMPSLVAEANRVDVDLPVAETTTLPRQIAASIQSLRVTASLVSYAAMLAILLTAVGLYSSISFSVSRRKREMAVRIALGAAPGQVGAMVIRQGMFIALAGVIAGLGCAAVGVSLVRHLLYGTGAGDGVWYLAAASTVLIISLLACLIPALRAINIEPAIALRDQ